MALTDNLFYKLQAASGETVPTDSIGGTTISGGAGSVALVNDPTDGYLWRVTGKMTAALTGTVKIGLDAQSTIAVRFRANRVSAPQESFIGFGNTGAAASYYVGDVFGSLAQQTFGVAYGSVYGDPFKAVANNTVVTAIIRLTEHGSGNDAIDIWYNNPGRVGDAPEVSITPDLFIYERFFQELSVGVTDGTLDLIDIAAWSRAITDAEAAAVANDIRGQLGGGGGGGDATAPGVTLTATSTLTPGAATGGSGATGSFHFDDCENNTGAGVIDAVAVNWTWISGAVGSASAIANGSGTMTVTGMTVAGLPLGAGFGCIKTLDGLVVAYQEGTVT